MTNRSRLILIAASFLTLAPWTAWVITGRHAYTKFVVVERVTAPADPDDPLTLAGFYDDAVTTRTVEHPEFHLGMFPVPKRLLDKHMLSVLSLTIAIWLMAVPLLLLARRCASRSSAHSTIQENLS